VYMGRLEHSVTRATLAGGEAGKLKMTDSKKPLISTTIRREEGETCVRANG